MSRLILADANVAIGLGGGSDSSNFTMTFQQPMDLKGSEWEMGLISMTATNSIANISAGYGNNTIQYYNGTTTRTVTYPDGTYGVLDIYTYLQGQMFANGDYTGTSSDPVYSITIGVDLNRLLAYVTLSNSYTITFNALGALIGFGTGTISAPGTTYAPNNANISNGVDSIIVRTNITTGAVSSAGNADSSIFTWSWGVPPGVTQVLTPQRPVYLPLRAIDQITSLTITLRDNQDRPVSFRGENVTMALELRPRK